MACAAVFSFVGCGNGDDNNAAAPNVSDASTPDAGSDASKDATTNKDSGTDSTVPAAETGADSSTNVDANSVEDTGITHDGSAEGDGQASDARVQDVIVGDADADIPQQPIEAGAFDASTSMAAFPGQVAAAICARTAACCGTSANAPNFNLSYCLGVSQGFNGSNLGTQYLDGGNVVFDANKAQECLANIDAIDCTNNDISSALATVLYQSCFGALTGVLGTGSPCHDAIECATGNFCGPSDGGTLGTCEPLKTEGQSCGDFATVATTSEARSLGQTECSYRGSGNTSAWCDFYNLTSGAAIADAGGWTCVADQQLDSICANGQECTSLVCDPGADQNVYKCASSSTFLYPFACAAYIVDAGADN